LRSILNFYYLQCFCVAKREAPYLNNKFDGDLGDQQSLFDIIDTPSQFDYEKFMAEEEAAKKTKVMARAKGKKKLRGHHAAGSQTNVSSEVYEWLQCLVTALLICVLVFAFFVRIIDIIGTSMVPSFHDGDSVIISNLFFEPKQGDIVVLRKLAFQEEPIIKRIIATEGQTVDIDFSTGTVYVDNLPLSEPYTAEPTYNPIDFDGKITVPENHVFVMGDNRNHSTDSRDSVIGCVDERYIMGKVLLRLLPFSDFGPID
jgi:signal peptidase I